jgi:hypothetical protein
MTIVKSSNNKADLTCWKSRSVGRELRPEFGTPQLEVIEDPNVESGIRSVEFGFDKSMAIVPPLECIQTMISVHKFKTLGVNEPQTSVFYIISGSSQGPFHGDDEYITCGHGAWEGAEGLNYYNGTIRLSGDEGVPIKETKIWRDAFQVATVECAGQVPNSNRQSSSKVNRIGRGE